MQYFNLPELNMIWLQAGYYRFCIFTDVAKESFGFASPMFVCVAECIKHSGLIGYDEEYDEIKNNHIWLLKHQSSPQLKKYEDMYKVWFYSTIIPTRYKNNIKPGKWLNQNYTS